MNPFFIIVFVVYLLVNSYIFYRTLQALPDIPALKICFYIVFFIIFFAFLAAMFGRHSLPLGVQKAFYMIGTAWLGVMLYLTLWFLVTDIVSLLNHFFHFLPDKFTPLLFHKAQVVLGYLLVVVVLSAGYFRFAHPTIVEEKIVVQKDGGSYNGLKIVGVSDLHLGVAIDKGRLDKYVELINEQNPDIVLIAGDLIDHNLLPLEMEKMYEELNRINAPLGTFMCLGNHEYISGLEGAMKFIDKTNITLLKDSAVLVNDSFWIVGRDDKMNDRRKMISQLVEGIDKTKPIILLDHQPYHLEEAEENDIDLQLSGHTHGGQLWPLNYIVNAIYEVGHGYKKKGNTHVYVSSGLGLWGPEFRVGTQSEMAVIELTFKEN
jgi:Predicted phosphohydrolases